jgi:hypothetical protein
LRHYLARNTVIIQQAARNVCNAASTAFPPSAAILTAFNFCLDASKVVADYYDAVVSFFDIMSSILERMSLLEQRLPPNGAHQNFVIRVFTALLEICAIAKRYREQSRGRLRKWCKAMIEGNDRDLKAAFDNLKTKIEQLESATLNMTLRTVTDSSRKLDKMDEKLDGLKEGQQDLIMLAKDQTVSLTSIRTMTMDAQATSEKILIMFAGIKERFDAGGDQQVDSSARKSTAVFRVKKKKLYSAPLTWEIFSRSAKMCTLMGPSTGSSKSPATRMSVLKAPECGASLGRLVLANQL